MKMTASIFQVSLFLLSLGSQIAWGQAVDVAQPQKVLITLTGSPKAPIEKNLSTVLYVVNQTQTLEAQILRKNLPDFLVPSMTCSRQINIQFNIENGVITPLQLAGELRVGDADSTQTTTTIQSLDGRFVLKCTKPVKLANIFEGYALSSFISAEEIIKRFLPEELSIKLQSY